MERRFIILMDDMIDEEGVSKEKGIHFSAIRPDSSMQATLLPANSDKSVPLTGTCKVLTKQKVLPTTRQGERKYSKDHRFFLYLIVAPNMQLRLSEAYSRLKLKSLYSCVTYDEGK
jgi:hypothetical protein